MRPCQDWRCTSTCGIAGFADALLRLAVWTAPEVLAVPWLRHARSDIGDVGWRLSRRNTRSIGESLTWHRGHSTPWWRHAVGQLWLRRHGWRALVWTVVHVGN